MLLEGHQVDTISEQDLDAFCRLASSIDISQLLLSLEKDALGHFFKQLSYPTLRLALGKLSEQAAAHAVNNMDSVALNEMLVKGGNEFLKRLPSLLSPDEFIQAYSRVPPVTRPLLKSAIKPGEHVELIRSMGQLEQSSSAEKLSSEFMEPINIHGAGNKVSIASLLAELERQKEKLEAAEEWQETYSKSGEEYARQILEFKTSILKMQEDHHKALQAKIEVKLPLFVQSAIELLTAKEKAFSDKADAWNLKGNIAMALAVISSIVGLSYGAHLFSEAAKSNIDWLFFGFLLLKGLIVISLFAAWARHCYTVASAYMHESLKRADRTHAINFGKLYLDIYGNDVSQADMKAVFENWNLDSESAFVKIKTGNFEPKVVGQVTRLIDSISKATHAKNGKSVT